MSDVKKIQKEQLNDEELMSVDGGRYILKTTNPTQFVNPIKKNL
jgi:bacteriocin-like protein